ncbi:serine/threonine-protein kinase [Nocardioides mangrovi]|uniref:non-specific serine/threonine protein kinase n=1 Tax=Nocardioides mangrovi TaxID=2874580 RepID=A0ABS7UIX2_9ACTN|nr:serine/threonine-protein kinase [Nocardioides mangrovi]MBZ5740995.1 serine/threonine protein kinase [Nocardioides mangrovi]
MIAGRYVLDREIGRGGMGAVWLGTDEVLGRQVALKRVGMGPGGATPDLERAEREARLAARLNHPHVVAIYDLVEDGDERWLVMEYVAGVTLAALVRSEGPLPNERAAAIVRQAADALAAAHAAGIVHRDVKPSNILVGPDGQVKLSDFGIARAQADASLTQTGLVTGSPAYLAPEVASGQQATAASDMWSLGATLYHSLAGQAPYEVGDNVLGALYRIVHEEPPRLAGAGWLDPLLRATMATDPHQRWTSAQVRDYLATGPSAAAALPVPAAAPVAETPTLRTLTIPPAAPPPAAPPVTPPPRERRGRGAVAILAVAAIVVAVALVAWLALRGDDTPAETGTDKPTRSASSGPATSGTSQAAVTEDGMENFVEDYLATVTTDPHAAWQQLTPDFQAQSGNFGQYQKFWRTISTADMTSAQADPESKQITYTVEYQHPDGSKTSDEVTLTLEGTDGDYLIAAED